MSRGEHASQDARLVGLQVARVPRDPWRVGSRCEFGRPNTIVSPSRLADGTPFPTLAWLTCPYLIERIGAEESEGAVAEWGRRAADDDALAERLRAADVAVRAARAAESDGEDACAGTGIAGQSDPLKVKCLHAHVALALVGIDDPIGGVLLSHTGASCDDDRCARLLRGATGRESDE